MPAVSTHRAPSSGNGCSAKHLFLFVLPLLLAMAFFGSGNAEANDWKATYDEKYGALNMNEFIGRSIQDYIAFQQKGGKQETEVMGRGYLIDNVLMSQWVITRSVVYGFSNFQSALSRMRSDEVTKAIMLPTAQTFEDADFTERNAYAVPGSPPQAARTLTINDVDLSDPRIQDSSIYQAHKRYTDILDEVNQGGFFSGDTIFKKMQFVGVMLLAVSVMVKLALMAYKAFIEQETVLGVAWFRAIFNFLVLMFLIMYAGRIAMFGISLSDDIKNLILGWSFQGANGISTVMDLMDSRMEFISIKMSFSFVDFLKSAATTFLTYGLGWLGYFLASGAIFVLIIAGDVMMGLTVILAPVVCALSLIPGYEDSIGGWLKNYISLLFYGPLAAVYVILLVGIMSIGMDTSPVAFIIITIAYVMGAVQIPSMARNLSGTVLAGVALSISAMPVNLAAKGVSGGLRGMMGGMGGMFR